MGRTPELGVVNGPTKNEGLAKFHLNCKRLTVSFFERFFASQSLEFLAKQSWSQSRLES